MKPFLLTLLTMAPFAGALVVGLVLSRRGPIARLTALAWHVGVLLLACWVWADFDVGERGMQFVERREWVPSLGVEYHLGLDGLGLVCVLLAAALPLFSAVLSRRSAEGREGLYHALLLLLQGGLFGTFTALSFFHWFLFWELSLVPAYLLVRLFGGRGAGPASFQFFLYTMVGSVTMLLGFLALRAAGGSFDFLALADLGRSGQLGETLRRGFPASVWGADSDVLLWMVFGGVFLGFAVKVPIWPFHTWLPETYTVAPAPVTMVLTGVMSKMGIYGLLRVVMPIFPEQWRAVQGVVLGLALATVIWPVLAAFVQSDLKRLLAYSSINHVGYCLLGMAIVGMGGSGESTAVVPALNGAILQMLNHGLTAATLFGCVEMIERRTAGLRDLREFGGLRKAAPVLCGLMGISVFASIGLPGLNGFVSEFLIFRGVFEAAPWAAAAGSLGLLGTAIFLLTMMQRMFHGPLDVAWAEFRDLGVRERVELGIPVGLMLVLGLQPDLILRLTNATVLQMAGGN